MMRLEIPHEAPEEFKILLVKTTVAFDALCEAIISPIFGQS
jgi:hypothetical protein